MAFKQLAVLALIKFVLSFSDPEPDNSVNIDIKQLVSGSDGCNGCTVCELQSVTGKGKASLVRFYYDDDSGQCLPFIYSGKGGNANRFMTLAECKDKCGHRPYESSLAIREPNNTYLAFDYSRCNDDYLNNKWSKLPGPKNYFDAMSECKKINMELACPNNMNNFIPWIAQQGLVGEVWVAGKQGEGEYFNTYSWESGYYIGRFSYPGGNADNVWDRTSPNANPLYPSSGNGCVAVKQYLSVHNCITSLFPYYCSPKSQ